MGRFWAIVVILVAGVAIGSYRFMQERSPTMLSAPIAVDLTNPNMAMPVVAEKAVYYASLKGKTLDYNPESVKIVEQLLGELHDAREKGELSENDLNLQALHFGGYIGEVIRRKFGGTWSTDHPVAGKYSFSIKFNNVESFPVTWCGKRIQYGDEDNVWFKFEVVTTDKYPAATQPIATRPG